MKFENYITQYEYRKARGRIPQGVNPHEYYRRIVARCKERPDSDNTDRYVQAIFLMEDFWHDNIRPYYKVWPCIHKALIGIPLDINMDDVELPLNVCFAIRLGADSTVPIRVSPKYNPMTGSDTANISSVLVKTIPPQHGYEDSGMCIGIAPQCYDDNAGGHPKTNLGMFRFFTGHHKTFADAFDEQRFIGAEHIDFLPIVKLAIGVLLMAHDPTIITAEVLSKDRRKYEETGDQKYVGKARKRGIVGWSIGEKYETCPHYRRPHFGIRHTGKGRTIPRIVPIRGAVVHTKKLTTVPTGYITPSGVEVEPNSE